MVVRSITLGALLFTLLAATPAFAAGSDATPPPGYVPEPDLEDLIKRATDKDRIASGKAVELLRAKGAQGERALNWHIQREATPAGRAKYAEVFARSCRGQLGYRVTLELQPDGSGTIALWSDRNLLAECGKRAARMNGQPEPNYDEDALRTNPFSKVELMKFMPEGMKYLEGRVETREGRIEAMGVLGFKSFDQLAGFAESFDTSGYYMIHGCALSDRNNLRLLQCRKTRESDADLYQRNLLLFYNVHWEFVLDFKGRLHSNNASRTDGSRLVWGFNCFQMLRGETAIEASFTNEGLQPRATEDNTVAIPAVVQAGQPIAVPKQKEIRARVFNRAPGAAKPTAKELRDKGQLVELDARSSLPRGATLQYQWVQTFGADLNLSAEALSKDYVCLIIKEPGEYRFELTVSVNGSYSKPSEVRVFVEGDAPPAVAKQPEPPPPVRPDPPPPPPVAKIEPPVARPPEVKVVSPPPPPPQQPPQQPKPISVEKPPETGAPKAVKADPAKAKELHAEGVKAFKAGDNAKAKALLSEACDLNLDDMEARFDLGLVLMELDEMGLAVVKFEEVAATTSKAAPLMNIGHCYSRMGNLNDARLWYRRGTAIGKDSVLWEPLWQLGQNQLRAKDYESAWSYIKEAETKAAEAKVRDYRLLRDAALALHHCKQNGEALKRLEGMQALGFTPNAELLAAVKKGAGDAPKTEPVKVAVVQPKVEPPQTQPKIEPKVEPRIEPKVEPKAVEPVKPVEPPKTVETPKVAPEPPKVEPKQPAPEPEPPKVAVKPPEPVKPPPKLPEPRTSERKPKKVEAKPTGPKKPLPPVPSDFNDALAAGKRALQNGEQLLKEKTEDSKRKAGECWDEAEAMLRGAWAQKPGDEEVLASFQNLAEHTGAVALVKNTYIRSKAKGLVVLDAEPSIAPCDKEGNPKPLYYVWEQVDGEDLDLRPEDMAQKKRGVRIARAGTYKFELVVSDGARGGSPVQVTVEVVE